MGEVREPTPEEQRHWAREWWNRLAYDFFPVNPNDHRPRINYLSSIWPLKVKVLAHGWIILEGCEIINLMDPEYFTKKSIRSIGGGECMMIGNKRMIYPIM